jgi:hypothetical protein
MIEVIKILQIVLLLHQGVSRADLMLKEKYSFFDINNAEKVLNFINRLE